MKYEKPIISILSLALDKAVASGLGEWLSENGYSADVEQNITTFEVNS